MFKRLIGFSLGNSALILTVASALLLFIGFRLPSVPVDIFPELNAPTVVVMCEASGLAADEVEQYVTFPVESSVNGITGVRRVRTSSAIGLSVAYVEFEWGTDIYRARQLVSERLDAVREDLPPDTHAEMTPITSITGEIMLLAISSPGHSVSPLDLRTYAEYDLRNKLLAIPGVAQISVIGGELPEYQVAVEQEKLRLYDLSVDDVVRAASESHSTLSAGYLPDVGGLELPIRQSGRVSSVNDIEGTVIKYHDGAPVTIGQVADVRLGPSPKRGTGAEAGRPAVVMTVQKSPGVNTLVVTRQIDAMIDALEPTLPKDIHINREIFRQADFIKLSINNVLHSLRDAAIIVSIILLLFLLNVRTAIITLVAIPLSLAVGILLLDALGMTINVMTLGGLTIAVGSLVDDAIIGMENAFRRLGENAQADEVKQHRKSDVIYRAINEIAPSIVFATLIIVIVFLPLLFLQGIEGRFFRPLGFAFIVSILASLLVSLTVTPAMCKFMLHAKPTSGESREGWLVRWFKRWYAPALHVALRHRWPVLSSAGVATLLTLWLGASFGTSFLPEFNEGTFTVGLFAPPGTSLRASDRMAGSIEQRILQIDGVKSVTRRTGRAERDEHAEPVSNSELDVTITKGFKKEDIRAQIAHILDQVPGITANIGQPIEHRLSHILSGTPAAIAISVYGEDLNVLRACAKDIERELKSMPGTRDVAANREVMIQSLPVRFRPHDLAAYGLTPKSAAQQVRSAIFGVEVAEVHEGVRRFDLVVRLDDAERDSLRDLEQLVLRGMGGALVRLSDVADMGPEMASNLIARENAQRKAVISLNVAEGSNLGHLVEKVRERVDPIVSRRGYTVKYGGQFEAQQSASRTIFILSGFVLLLVLLLLNLAVGSVRVALLVLVNLPLSLIGGILGVYFTDWGEFMSNVRTLFGMGTTYTAPVISIASMVGFITLFGIAIRNGILLVNHYRHLVDEEGKSPYDAIIQGSMERLIPILMTALTAALALIPIVLKGNTAGNEILSPLSIVILGGLLSSTFLNLVVIPAGYAAIFRVSPPESTSSGSAISGDK